MYGTFPGIVDEGDKKYRMHGVFLSFPVNFWLKKCCQTRIFSEMTGIQIPDAGFETLRVSGTFLAKSTNFKEPDAEIHVRYFLANIIKINQTI